MIDTQFIFPTWTDISAAKAGTIYKDVYDEGLRFIIMKGGSSLCAYLGVSIDHPVSGFAYDDMPIDCHYGLTFSGDDNKNLPSGYWFYGWDYAHSGDYCDFYDREPLKGVYNHDDEKKWLVEDVESDAWEAIYQFKQLMKMSEKVYNKAKNNL